MKTVLVAEDNAVNRELITEMLEMSGHKVMQADDGAQALVLLETCRPDVVLLDLQMPVMDGRETIRRIRENPDWSDLPVIACTAYAMQGNREDILQSGFDGYLAKPITRADLLHAIDSLFL